MLTLIRGSLDNRRGVSLVGAIVGIGVLMLTVLAGMQMTGQLAQVEKKVMAVSAVPNIIYSVRTLIENDAAWKATLDHANNATAMACLINETDCGPAGADRIGPSKKVEFYLAEANGLELANPAGTKGFNWFGASCSTYNGTVGSGHSECVYRVKTEWYALCAAADVCISPKVMVEVTIEFNPKDTRLLNAIGAKHRADIIRGGDTGKQRIVLWDRKPDGFNGGDCGTSPTMRDITPADMYDSAGNVLGFVDFNRGNYVQLRAGIYDCFISSPGWRVGGHFIRLMMDPDTSSGSGNEVELLEGTRAFSDPLAMTQTRSEIRGRFTLNEDSYIFIEHFCSAPDWSNSGQLGLHDWATGIREYYTYIMCEKEA